MKTATRSPHNTRRIAARRELSKDLILIIIGGIIALGLAQVGLIEMIVNLLGGQAVASFFSGIFFTSAFTIAPASIALSDIAQHASVFTVAFWGALGAMCGDLILFFFIRDRFADDVIHSLKPSLMKHIARSFHLGFLKWLAPLIGAAIIFSPLPDEFGLALLGISKTRVALIIPISFVMNYLAIYALFQFVHTI